MSAFNPESQQIPQSDWMQVTCPKCEGAMYLTKTTIHLADGSETEEEVPCDQCVDGKVWEEIWT